MAVSPASRSWDGSPEQSGAISTAEIPAVSIFRRARQRVISASGRHMRRLPGGAEISALGGNCEARFAWAVIDGYEANGKGVAAF